MLFFHYCFLYFLIPPPCVSLLPSLVFLSTKFFTSLQNPSLNELHKSFASVLTNSFIMSLNFSFVFFLNFHSFHCMLRFIFMCLTCYMHMTYISVTAKHSLSAHDGYICLDRCSFSWCGLFHFLHLLYFHTSSNYN